MPNGVNERTYSVQPRFTIGDTRSGWAIVDGIFRFGEDLPPYGSQYRDMYLSMVWQQEPMTAGVFSTWVEKAQTVNWKVVGGRTNANQYATLLHTSDDNAGWSYHEGTGAMNYLTTDKGSMEELGRKGLNARLLNKLTEEAAPTHVSDPNYAVIKRLVKQATTGKVTSIQHLDAARLVKIGFPGMRWRYFPEIGMPVSIPDDNIIQITSLPTPMDSYIGYGVCPLSRLIDVKNLMVGYIKYFRQEIGDLPPELIAIVNGLSSTAFEDALKKYKLDREKKDLDTYGKIFWLGTDDPGSPVDVLIRSLTSPNKSFDWRAIAEWWIKVLALNVGEDVGEFWLLQRGESKTVQTVQAMKSKGKGVARYLAEKQRHYNMKIMPFGVTFEYDNEDDDADQQRAEILATKVGTVAELAKLGVDRQDPVFTTEEIRKMVVQYEIVPPDIIGETMPTVVGAMLKQIGNIGEETWVVHQDGRAYPVKPILRSDKDLSDAKTLYGILAEAYSANGNGRIKHQALPEGVEMVL